MPDPTARSKGPTPKESTPTPWRILANGWLETEPLMGSLAAHTIPGAEHSEPEELRHTRLIATRAGLRTVTVTLEPRAVVIDCSSGPEERGDIEEAVRAWLDLDADLANVHLILGADPQLEALIAARPGLRVVGTTDAFQTAVAAVLGQQVSLAAARTFCGRLVKHYGTPGPDGLLRFPTPAALSGTDPAEFRATLGVPAARARTVQTIAGAFEEARHDSDLPGPEGARRLPLTRTELMALPGIGPWTADYLAVRCGDRDAFAPGDLVLRRALGGISAKEAARRAQAWSPYRAYALTHLWTADYWP